MKRLISLCLALALLAFLVPQPVAAAPALDGYDRVAVSEGVELYYSHALEAIAVRDAAGNLWHSDVKDAYFDTDSANPIWKNLMRSLFSFTVSSERNTTLTSPAAQAHTLMRTDLPGGIRLAYSFPDIAIDIALDITLEDGRMVVDIPQELIVESGTWKLTSLDVLPFFGASHDAEEGYILMPDGAGSLLEFADQSQWATDKISWYLYSKDVNNIGEDAIYGTYGRTVKTAALPVYGIKRGNAAFAAIVSEGSCDCSINLSPSGYIVNLNRASAELIFRRRYEGLDFGVTKVLTLDKDIVRSRRTVTYVFLSDAEADYSGMAGACREFMLEKGMMKRSEQAAPPMRLDVFMGIEEYGAIFSKFVVATTFDQVIEMGQELVSRGVTGFDLCLMGWQKGGYGRTQAYTPASELGGKRGLERLSQWAEDNGVRLMLDYDFTKLNKGDGAFSTRDDVVYLKSTLALTSYSGARYYMSPHKLLKDGADKVLKGISPYRIDGLNLSAIGNLLFFDYNRNGVLNRNDVAEAWKTLADKVRQAYPYVWVDGGNAYMLSSADGMVGVPFRSSNYFVMDREVPFYQMVVHGSVAYASEPVNLFYDSVGQRLKMIEYGYLPAFYLTWESSSKLANSNYNFLYSSQFSEWVNSVEAAYKEYQETLAPLAGEYITSHDTLPSGLVCVTYSNGYRIYINYGAKPITSDGVTVAPNDYQVVR